MKVLLDENLPGSLRHRLHPHECVTVGHMGWSGTKNGKLLALAESNGFEWLITLDDDLPPEQNWEKFSVNVIVLKPHKQGKSSLYALVPKILLTIDNPDPPQLSWINSDN